MFIYITAAAAVLSQSQMHEGTLLKVSKYAQPIQTTNTIQITGIKEGKFDQIVH